MSGGVAKRFHDLLCQSTELVRFQRAGQIAGVGVADVDLFLVGRGYPWMQMGTNERPPRFGERLQRTYGDILRRDGIVDDVIGHDAIRVEDCLGSIDMAHVLHARRAPIVGLAPVELLLGMDDHRENGSRIGWKVNEFALHFAVMTRPGQRSRATNSEYRLLMSAAPRVSLLKTLFR